MNKQINEGKWAWNEEVVFNLKKLLCSYNFSQLRTQNLGYLVTNFRANAAPYFSSNYPI